MTQFASLATSYAVPAFGLAIGLALGLAYFATLRRVTALYLVGDAFAYALALHIARFLVLAAVLGLLARAGAGPLLAGALGLLIGRSVILRRAREEASWRAR